MPVDTFEGQAARFVAAAARAVPAGLAPLVFSSPLSARSPDLCLAWHTGYREKHRGRLLAGAAASLAVNALKGVVRMVYDFNPQGYIVQGDAAASLLVIPSICLSRSEGPAFATAYVRLKNGDGILVFGPLRVLGPAAVPLHHPGLVRRLSVLASLVRSGARAWSSAGGGLADRLLLLLLWLTWALGLHWLYDLQMGTSVENVVASRGTAKLGCVQEMHGYARILWDIAARRGITGHTVQHAAVTRGKRWYFCQPEERASGLRTPDVMYVYSAAVAGLLAPYLPSTSFVLGCSTRYDHWKDVPPTPVPRNAYCLFAGALAGFDNDALFAVLRRLVNEGPSLPLRLRLHPNALVRRADRAWLRKAVQGGSVILSELSALRTDIEGASLVVGMSTTVLEEALLLGRPVVQLLHPDYLQYIDLEGLSGALRKDFRDLSAADLPAACSRTVDTAAIRERLGLNNPSVTYDRLFQAPDPQREPFTKEVSP